MLAGCIAFLSLSQPSSDTELIHGAVNLTIRQRSHINLTRYLELPPVMVVYTSCNDFWPFPVWKLSMPSYQLKCHPETNSIDCKEAVPMLEFLIKTWDQPLAHKYIFVHAHEFSWHYPRSVFSQIQDLIKTSYFRDNDIGGVFPDFREGPYEPEMDAIYEYVFRNTSMPPKLYQKWNNRPCCSTFFVNSDLVRTRGVDEYKLIISRLRQWSRENPNAYGRDAAYFCSRILEYNWHVMLTTRSNVTALPHELRCGQ
jgi:hypothetical protein